MKEQEKQEIQRGQEEQGKQKNQEEQEKPAITAWLSRHKGVAALSGLLGILVFFLAIQAGTAIYTQVKGTISKERYFVIIDPGHGGNDPGKIGTNGVLEKDINLAVAFMLKEILEQNDCRVLMTRTMDRGLYQEEDRQKKLADLNARCKLINESDAELVVSIHQNSYTSPDSKGSQVFYQTTSEQGRRLADIIQKQMISSLEPSNRRGAKANSSYYMLKHTDKTMVIAECGFLSNPKEAEALSSPAYQRRVAWAIALGVLQYLETMNQGNRAFAES